MLTFGPQRMRIRLIAAAAALILALVGTVQIVFAATPTFDSPIGTSTNSGSNLPSKAAAGDFNSDGHLDVVVVDGSTPTVLRVLMGNGDGSFSATNLPISGPCPGSECSTNSFGVAVGDVNNDGHLDIVVANNQSPNLSVVLGNGDGTFQPATHHPFFGSNRSVALGDLNGNGYLDLIGGSCCTAAGVLLNNGDGTFGPTVIVADDAPLPGNPARIDIKVADLNGDGNLDVVIGNQSSDISVLLGDGTGNLTRIQLLDNLGSSANSVVVADFNGDGTPDIAANNLNGWINVFLGNGDGTFGAASSFPVGGDFPLGLAVADFNGDGNLDLAVSNAGSNNVSVLLGNGDGTFSAAVNFPDPTNTSVLHNPQSVLAADFDGDGKPDILTVNAFTRNVTVMLNTTEFTVGPLLVDIDIKPGSDPNAHSLNGNGVLPVAVLGSADFDVTSIDVDTVLFGVTGTEAAPLRSSLEDVNDDGHLDFVLHFNNNDLGLDPATPGGTTVTLILTGQLTTGEDIEGEDEVWITPSNNNARGKGGKGPK